MVSNVRYAVRDSGGGDGFAIIESIFSNARYAVGDSYRGEGGATTESIFSNTRHAIRDGDGGEGGTIFERIISNTRYAVSSAVVGDGFGDGSCGEVKIIRGIVTFLACDFYSVRLGIARNIVVQITRLEVIRMKGGGCHEGEEKGE